MFSNENPNISREKVKCFMSIAKMSKSDSTDPTITDEIFSDASRIKSLESEANYWKTRYNLLQLYGQTVEDHGDVFLTSLLDFIVSGKIIVTSYPYDFETCTKGLVPKYLLKRYIESEFIIGIDINDKVYIEKSSSLQFGTYMGTGQALLKALLVDEVARLIQKDIDCQNTQSEDTTLHHGKVGGVLHFFLPKP